MSYPPEIWTEDEGEASAWLVRGDSAPDVTYDSSGNRVRYLARGHSTGGTYGLYHWEFAGPESGPGAHFHKTLTESFYGLSGIVTIATATSGSSATRATSFTSPRVAITASASGRTREHAAALRPRRTAGAVLRETCA